VRKMQRPLARGKGAGRPSLAAIGELGELTD
jgi:hypothetical protein